MELSIARRREKLIEQSTKDEAINLALDTLQEGGQCLIFESSRKNCMAFAKKAASKIKKILSAEDKKFLTMIADKVFENSEIDTVHNPCFLHSFRCCFSPRRTYHPLEGTSGRRLQGKKDQADLQYSHACSWTQLTCQTGDYQKL